MYQYSTDLLTKKNVVAEYLEGKSAVVAYDSELVGKYVQHHNMQA